MIIEKDGDVVLRELEEADIPRIAEYGNNEKVSINLRDAFPYPYTIEDAKRFFKMANERDPKTILAIEYKGDYAGNISLTKGNDVYRKSAEIGYFIGEPFWNKGIMTKAVKLIVKFGFEKLDIVRIHTGVYDYNTASQKVLEKCGFEKEGVFKKSVFKRGKFCNEVRYAILKKKNSIAENARQHG